MSNSPAIETTDTEALCADCLRAGGFCRSCLRRCLPQLAQPFWYRLVGTVLIEQKKRQLNTKPDARAERIRVRKERKRVTRIQRLVAGGFARACPTVAA